MEQLLAVQQEIQKRGQNIPLFGIMTDVMHNIFIKLHCDGQFEFEKNDQGELRVQRVNFWNDFDEIVEIINGLCQLHKKFVSTDSVM